MATQNYHSIKNAALITPATVTDLGSVSQPYGNLFLQGNVTLGSTTLTSTNTIVPKISSITYVNGTTAALLTGNETITINGSGFQPGLTVYLNNILVASATQVNTNTVTFLTPAKTVGNYSLAVINSDGGSATFIPGINYSDVPTWVTTAGTLGSFNEGDAIANTLAATDGVLQITYSITSGSLPSGLSIGASNGNITGTLGSFASGATTYNFTVTATDPQNQTANRNFSYTVTGDTLTFNSPTSGTSYTPSLGSAISNISLSATSTLGKTITYGASCLPSGLSISGSNITGTPTAAVTKTATIYANTNTRSANISLNFTVSSPYMTATGGTVYTCGNYKYHKFITSSTFTVTSAGTGGNNTADYIMVGGGGGGGTSGNWTDGGGGAGGLLAGTAIGLTATAYTITVGAGGTSIYGGASLPHGKGQNTTFNGLTAYGGGPGHSDGRCECLQGGSGGGGGSGSKSNGVVGQGNKGGQGGGSDNGLGGGGGAGSAGLAGYGVAGAGGGGDGSGAYSATLAVVGAGVCVSGTRYIAGGGGAGWDNRSSSGPGAGGKGGGGNGAGKTRSPAAQSGATNTGGGGGGGDSYYGGAGGFGADGIVIIKYRFQ